jgi:effector-binding domain-containing protein
MTGCREEDAMTMLTVRVDATAVRAVPLMRAAEVAAPAVGRDVRDGFRPAGATTRPPVRACSLDATPAAVVRAPMGRDRISGWLCGAYRSVRARLAVEGIDMTGPAFACYTDTGDGIEVEAGYPVATAVHGDGEVVPSGLPAVSAATTVHEGPPASMDAAYLRIEAWLAEYGFAARGRHWERYLVGGVTGETDPSRWRTEIVVPYGWDHWVPSGSGGGRALGTSG